MRIKNYDYKTCLKLKNPMGNYKEVLKFVENDFILVKKEEFIYTGGMFNTYVINNLILAVNNTHAKSLNFYTNDRLSESIYFVYENEVPRIHNKEKFEELKRLFLNYKLNEHLKSSLKVNEVVEKRNNKI